MHKASDLQNSVVLLKRLSTTNRGETSEVNNVNCDASQETFDDNVRSPNKRERNATNKSYCSYTTSSARLNRTPKKCQIKDQDTYESETTCGGSNKTPVKPRSTMSNAFNSPSKDGSKTANIINFPIYASVNKSPSIESKVSTPTKNTPSKLDRALKYLNIDMVNQNTKSPVRQIKIKPGMELVNLRRGTDAIVEAEETSNPDTDSDSYTAMSLEETTTSPSKISHNPTCVGEQLSKSKSLSTTESRGLSSMNSPCNTSSEVKSPTLQRTPRLQSSSKTSFIESYNNSNKRERTGHSVRKKDSKNDQSHGIPLKPYFTPSKKENPILSENCSTPRSSSKYSKKSDLAQQVLSPQQKQGASVTTPVSKKVCFYTLL